MYISCIKLIASLINNANSKVLKTCADSIVDIGAKVETKLCPLLYP